MNFEFHNFPTLFCGFCDLFGHKIGDCVRYEMAQQQAAIQQEELHQAEINAYMAALQQQQQQQEAAM